MFICIYLHIPKLQQPYLLIYIFKYPNSETLNLQNRILYFVTTLIYVH